MLSVTPTLHLCDTILMCMNVVFSLCVFQRMKSQSYRRQSAPSLVLTKALTRSKTLSRYSSKCMKHTLTHSCPCLVFQPTLIYSCVHSHRWVWICTAVCSELPKLLPKCALLHFEVLHTPCVWGEIRQFKVSQLSGHSDKTLKPHTHTHTHWLTPAQGTTPSEALIDNPPVTRLIRGSGIY